MRAIIVSASSDIGFSLAQHWKRQGWDVVGTFRTESSAVKNLKTQIPMVYCDLADVNSVEKACLEMIDIQPNWDVLVFAPGLMDPIGAFEKIDFNNWQKALEINLLRPLRLLHLLLPHRNRLARPTVLFFSGAGTNSSALNYSAYALSKVSLIKACELLDAEIPDTRFTILGPGWVRTKIHDSTLKAGQQNAGQNYQRTLEQFSQEKWTPIEKVIECCDWVITSPSKGLNGRNFSVVFDSWGSRQLEEALENDPDMYKLRRFKNTWGQTEP